MKERKYAHVVCLNGLKVRSALDRYATSVQQSSGLGRVQASLDVCGEDRQL